MKRQFVGIALFLPLLACLMGASSITFGANQPVPNPGGKAGTIEGKGTYVVDPLENFGTITFAVHDTKLKQTTLVTANAKAGAWDSILSNLGAGNYDAVGQLDTVNKGQPVYNYTKTVNVNIK